MTNRESIHLTGRDLTAAMIEAVASGATVTTDPHSLEQMQRSREVVQRAAQSNQPIYGVTTGLGPKVTEALPRDAVDSFSVNTIRGRNHAVGSPLPVPWVRAGMVVRINTLLSGAAGARPQLAEHIALCLNHQITPLIPETGTIGVADLSWGGAFGSAMIGEGKVQLSDGTVTSAVDAFNGANIKAFTPQLREGLALVSHSCFTGGISALAWSRLWRSFQATQVAGALSMEAFRASLTPLDERVLRLRPQRGQIHAARQLLQLLEGSALLKAGTARRLQDPLSIRNMVQVHGGVQATLDLLEQAVTDEINGASDLSLIHI